MIQRCIRTLFLVGAILLCAVRVNSAAAEGEKATLKAYKPKAGGFEILMPGTPKERTTVEKTAAGDMPTSSASADTDTMAFSVSYSELPEPLWKASPKKLVDNLRDGAVGRVKGKVVVDRELKLAGKYAGREIKIVADQYVMVQRMYVVEHRAYQMAVSCPPGGCKDADVQAWMSSFKLAK